MSGDDERRGGGSRSIGQVLVARARSLGLKTLLAESCEESVGSIALFRALGWEENGRLREVGHKFQKRYDGVYLQLMLAPPL